MPAEADDLLYNYEGISTISGAINAFVTQMNANLDEVDGEFKSLIANGWSGKGADAFYPCSQKWHTAANSMAVTLQKLSTTTDQAGFHMQAADAQAAARFM